MKYGFLKVGVCTPAIKVADCNYNAQKIIDAIKIADSQKVKCLLFPRLVLTGATCGDLYFSDTLQNGVINALQLIIDATKNTDVLAFVGAPIKRNTLYYDCAVAIKGGKILGVCPRWEDGEVLKGAPDNVCDLLIGDEYVPFGCELIYSINDKFKIGVSVEEDVDYERYLAKQGVTIIARMCATADTMVSACEQINQVSALSKINGCTYLVANAGDGESTTDNVYAGVNFICENGQVLAQSKPFDCSLLTSEADCDFNEKNKNFNVFDDIECEVIDVETTQEKTSLTRYVEKFPFLPKSDNVAQNAIELQAQALKKRIVHTGAKSVIIGVSGGLDSTLALIVAVRAVKLASLTEKDVIAVTMPCFGTTKRTLDNSLALAKELGTTLKKISIAKAVTQHFKDIGHSGEKYDAAYENAQARERTQVLMDLANLYSGLVIGTGDLSELALGWATYNGDHMSMYGVNCSIPKTLVRALTEYVARSTDNENVKKILLDVLDTPVSPELIPSTTGETITQKTEDLVGPYELHDFFIYNLIKNGFSVAKVFNLAVYAFKDKYNAETIAHWLKTFIRRFFTQQFKRSCVPDGVQVSEVSLSPRNAWRMPSDAVSELWQQELESAIKENDATVE